VVKPDKDSLLTMVAMADHHRTMDINKLHKELGHASQALIQQMAKFFGWPLKNQFATCESWAHAKSLQKDTNKEMKA